jgi:hypothetical protein
MLKTACIHLKHSAAREPPRILRLSNEERKRRAADVAFYGDLASFSHIRRLFFVFADGVAKKT